MASEMLEKIKALRKQCLDQMTKQQETCTQAKELRLELMGKLLNYYEMDLNKISHKSAFQGR
ncbi:hypothetical protein PMIN02_002156 [Paraphaeosphaeria minitans]